MEIWVHIKGKKLEEFRFILISPFYIPTFNLQHFHNLLRMDQPKATDKNNSKYLKMSQNREQIFINPGRYRFLLSFIIPVLIVTLISKICLISAEDGLKIQAAQSLLSSLSSSDQDKLQKISDTKYQIEQPSVNSLEFSTTDQPQSEASNLINGRRASSSSSGHTSNSQTPKRLVRSRYKLKSTGSGSHHQASNYSQPIALNPIDYQQLASGRSLMSNGPVIDYPGTSPNGYYYQGASQRASMYPFGESSTSSHAIVEQPMDEQQSGLGPDLPRLYPPTDYAGSARQAYTSPTARAYPFSTITNSRMREPSTIGHYGGQANVNFGGEPYLQASNHYPEYDPYIPSASINNLSMGENLASYSMNHQQNLLNPHFQHLPLSLDPGAHFDMLPNHIGARSRWSWPWIDVSSLGHLPASATFKKFAHHQHHHHHKEEYPMHHHEQDHLASKWEHGVTLGEIACIAVAVVLGIIILGSPFFLLYLMLFNGGNLLGATQMGLIAPAIPAAAATTAAGRRRKRSIEGSSHEREKLNAQELLGDYLMQHLSPFMDSDKLVKSFERFMSVKDDIDKIVKKLGITESKSSNSYESTSTDYQHTEMRRRRRRRKR